MNHGPTNRGANHNAGTFIPILAILLLLFASAFARAVTIRMIDGKTITGNIKGLDSKKLVIQPPEADGAATAPSPIKVPLQEIIDLSLTWGERIGVSKPAPAHAVPPGLLWEVHLGSSDQVTARLTSWTDAGVSLAVSTLNDAAFTIPAEQLHAIWAVNDSRAADSKVASLVSKAKDQVVAAPGQDVVYVATDGDVKSVAGIALGFEGQFLRFKYQDQERKIKLDRVIGLVLAQRPMPRDKELYEVFTMANSADVVSARIQSLDIDPGDGTAQKPPMAVAFVCLPLNYGGADAKTTFVIPIGKIEKMSIRNGRLAWLGDLVPSAVEQVPYFDRLIPYRVDRSLSGGDLTFTGQSADKLAHGIAVHSQCHLTYDLGGAYESFRVKVGFQQPEGKLGRAAVRILADDKVLWQNPDLKGTGSPVPLNLNVKGVKTLRLEADFGKDQDVGDDIVWGDARLLKAAPKNEP